VTPLREPYRAEEETENGPAADALWLDNQGTTFVEAKKLDRHFHHNPEIGSTAGSVAPRTCRWRYPKADLWIERT
jgi:hypothetical protein